MLQTRFILFIENFMIRRVNITIFFFGDDEYGLLSLGGFGTELG